MGKKDPRVDAYIAKSAEFARPILKHLRKLVHQADAHIEETIKWGMPSFMHEGIVCGMAAFKQHCAFGFWKGAMILDGAGKRVDDAMGQFGRIKTRKDLPPDRKLIGYIKQAVDLNVRGIKDKRKERKPAKARPVPAYFKSALATHKQAAAGFKAMSTSHRNEYVEWIGEAKQQATRDKRIATALEWLATGKSRNWKYEKRA